MHPLHDYIAKQLAEKLKTSWFLVYYGVCYESELVVLVNRSFAGPLWSALASDYDV